MHLNRTADGRGQLLAGSFERNDDVIRSQLRIIHDFLRLTHGAEGNVNAVEDLIPVRHWLRSKDLIEYCRQLRTVLRQLGSIREPRIREDVLTIHCFQNRGYLVRSGYNNEPGAIGRAIRVQSRICGMGSIVKPIETRTTERGLDKDAGRPDTRREKRSRDVGSFAGAFATIKSGQNRGINADRSCIVTATCHWPGRWLSSIARHE